MISKATRSVVAFGFKGKFDVAKICIISFSGRSGGNCGSIAEELREHLKSKGEVEVYDFSNIAITPCGRCDCECFREETIPKFV